MFAQRHGCAFLLLSILSCLLLVASSGCTEAVTFANQSREEGMQLYRDKAYADAAGAFRNAIRQEPRDYRSQFYLGVCYDELEQHQQAFAQYRAAREILPNTMAGKDDDEFRVMVLDTMAASVARFDPQEIELNRLEKEFKDSQKGEDWFLLAKVYRLKGDADRAIDCYRRAAHWDTWNFAVRKEFGLYLLEPLNQTREAEYWLRHAYRLQQDDEQVNAGLAKLGLVPIPASKAKEQAQNGAGRPINPTASTPQN